MGMWERILFIAALFVVLLFSYALVYFWARRYERLFKAFADWRYFPEFISSPRMWRFQELIHRLEERTNTVLTSGARQMLLIPIIEQYERGGEFSVGEVEESLSQLFTVMREDPSPVDSRNTNIRSSLSVIRAFWRRFCNIPPFCSGVER